MAEVYPEPFVGKNFIHAPFCRACYGTLIGSGRDLYFAYSR
jgi:hypothetical protein